MCGYHVVLSTRSNIKCRQWFLIGATALAEPASQEQPKALAGTTSSEPATAASQEEPSEEELKGTAPGSAEGDTVLEGEPIVVDSGDLKEYLGQPPFTSDRIYDRTPPGVVMGLAW